jgi:hypothetical protein
MKDPELLSIKHMPVRKVSGFTSSPLSDTLSIEEPFEIRIGYGPGAGRRPGLCRVIRLTCLIMTMEWNELRLYL